MMIAAMLSVGMHRSAYFLVGYGFGDGTGIGKSIMMGDGTGTLPGSGYGHGFKAHLMMIHNVKRTTQPDIGLGNGCGCQLLNVKLPFNMMEAHIEKIHS